MAGNTAIRQRYPRVGGPQRCVTGATAAVGLGRREAPAARQPLCERGTRRAAPGGAAHLTQALHVLLAAALKLVKLAAARRVDAGGAEEAGVAAGERKGGSRLPEGSRRDDDLLHPGSPGALQHTVEVWLVVGLAVVGPLVHRVQEVGPDVCTAWGGRVSGWQRSVSVLGLRGASGNLVTNRGRQFFLTVLPTDAHRWTTRGHALHHVFEW